MGGVHAGPGPTHHLSLPPSCQNFLHKWDRRSHLQSLTEELEDTSEMTQELPFRCVGAGHLFILSFGVRIKKKIIAKIYVKGLTAYVFS